MSPESLDVVFQPIVELETRRTFAYEALVRCRLPALSAPPSLFAHAVSIGCTGRLGRSIRELTVQRCRGVPVFTNVHPVELSERWLVRPDDPILSHDSDVYIEVTESVPFSHYDICVQVLRELRSRGRIHLAIDDLGSGFSNLKYIVDLQPAVVKLDMKLVRGLDRHPRQRALVSSIVAMCADQGAMVVAEGVETVGELAAVIDSGCQLAQGYLFARPAWPPPVPNWPAASR